MVKRLMVFLLLGTMTLLAASSSQKPDCDQLPQQLRETREEIGCGPVHGFYDAPGMIDPPYLYGWLPGNKEETAVFWCYRGEEEDEPYLLVFVEGLGQGRKGRVTATIPWGAEPGGLSLFDIRNAQLLDSQGVKVTDSQHLPLDLFVYIDNPKEHGPKGKTTEYAPLQEYYDGLMTIIYRHEGRWLWLGLD